MYFAVLDMTLYFYIKNIFKALRETLKNKDEKRIRLYVNIRYHENYYIRTMKLDLLFYVGSTTSTCMKSRLFHVNVHEIYLDEIKAICLAIV